MAWQDDLLDASLGGASFFALSVRSSGGRRTVLTEFPGRDEPGSEDLGRSARRWEVEGIVIGPEYMTARDALLEVLEAKGPHKWVHPWWGEFQVVLDGAFTTSEAVSEGGAARFSFNVVESGTGAELRIEPSPAADLVVAAAAVVAAADAEVQAKLALPGILAAVAGAIEKIADVMQDVRRKSLGALPGVDELTDGLNDLKEERNALAALPSAIVSEVSGLLAALAAVVRTSAAADDAPFPGGEKKVRVDVALQASEELQATSLETEPLYPGVPVDPDDLEAERVMQRAFRATAAANYAALFVDLELESTADAAKILDSLGDAIEAVMLDPGAGDALYTALTDLRAALDAQLQAAAQDLPSLTTYTPAASLPAVLLAFWIHGDPTRDLEIVGRNSVRDPNFVPGGEPLEVLSG